MATWQSLAADPRHEVAREALDEGQYDEALEIWGNLLDDTAKELGEMSPSAGFFYYFYGTTLLCKAEDNSTLFGDAVNQAAEEEAKRQCAAAAEEVSKAVAESTAGGEGSAASEVAEGGETPVAASEKADEAGLDKDSTVTEGAARRKEGDGKGGADAEEDGGEEEEEGDREEEEEGDDDDEEEGDEEDDSEAQPEAGADAPLSAEDAKEQVLEDLEIAWENLEAARAIFEKMQDDVEAKRMLGRVHGKLGDLQKMNGNHADAVRDYRTALGHLEVVDAASSGNAAEFLAARRRIAEYHNNMANCLLFAKCEAEQSPGAAQAAGAEISRLHGECVAAFQACRNELQNCVGLAATDDVRAQLQELVDELDETIEAQTGADNELFEKERQSAPKTSFSFGADASAEGSTFQASAFGTSSFGTSAFAQDAAPVVNVLSVKRKSADTRSAALVVPDKKIKV